MEDVTDTVFRTLLRRWAHRYGRRGPAVMYTEFTRVDAAIRAEEAQRTGARYNGRLRYAPVERPLFAQLWGTRPDEFVRAAEAVAALGFDGIDINLGCPARKIRKMGACSALIAAPHRVAEIIAACRAGSDLPLTVKTRIGLDRVVTEEWIGFLLTQNLNAITVHGRIADEMSEEWADWREVRTAVALRNAMDARAVDGTRTLIIGNGDVRSIEHGYRLAETTGVDGIMIGRGVFSDPLVFCRIDDDDGDGVERTVVPSWGDLTVEERLHLLREHIVAFTEYWGDRRNYEVLKKFYRNYAGGSATSSHSLGPSRGGAAPQPLLDRLYATTTATEALAIIDERIASTGVPLTDAYSSAAYSPDAYSPGAAVTDA